MATSPVPCLYRNSTARFQIVRLVYGDACLLERTLLPGQTLSFSAPAPAQLQVHTSTLATTVLEDTIPCGQLQQQFHPLPALIQVA